MVDYIKARRSIRKYTPEPISEEDVRTLLEAAMAAPSANNSQPWEFVVVRDDRLKSEISQVHAWAAMAAEAAAVFVVCGRPDDSDHWVEDCSAATENLLLAVTARALGAVWVAIYPQSEQEQQVQRILNLSPDWRPLCLVPVGHPAETRPPRTQYDPEKVHYDAL